MIQPRLKYLLFFSVIFQLSQIGMFFSPPAIAGGMCSKSRRVDCDPDDDSPTQVTGTAVEASEESFIHRLQIYHRDHPTVLAPTLKKRSSSLPHSTDTLNAEVTRMAEEKYHPFAGEKNTRDELDGERQQQKADAFKKHHPNRVYPWIINNT